MKTLVKITIIGAALVSLASCEFFKPKTDQNITTETEVEVTTSGLNIDTTEVATTSTITGLVE